MYIYVYVSRARVFWHSKLPSTPLQKVSSTAHAHSNTHTHQSEYVNLKKLHAEPIFEYGTHNNYVRKRRMHFFSAT